MFKIQIGTHVKRYGISCTTKFDGVVRVGRLLVANIAKTGGCKLQAFCSSLCSSLSSLEPLAQAAFFFLGFGSALTEPGPCLSSVLAAEAGPGALALVPAALPAALAE